MFENRYGRQVTQARAEFARAAGVAAERIVAVLRANPIHQTGSYPMAEVHRRFAEQHRALWTAVERYPLAIAVDTDGRPDPLGTPLAKLMSALVHLLVSYHGLSDVPEAQRGPMHMALRALLSAANSVVALAEPGDGTY